MRVYCIPVVRWRVNGSLFCRVIVSVTTTSISSRERPRARGMPAASSNAASADNRRHHSSTPPPRRARPDSRVEQGPSIDRVQHLRTDQDWRNQSKSWDSGLDMFGAVPFSTSSVQVSIYLLTCLQLVTGPLNSLGCSTSSDTAVNKPSQP